MASPNFFPFALPAGAVDRLFLMEAYYRTHPREWRALLQIHRDEPEFMAGVLADQHVCPETGRIYFAYDGNPPLNASRIAVQSAWENDIDRSLVRDWNKFDWQCIDWAGADDDSDFQASLLQEIAQLMIAAVEANPRCNPKTKLCAWIRAWCWPNDEVPLLHCATLVMAGHAYARQAPVIGGVEAAMILIHAALNGHQTSVDEGVNWYNRTQLHWVQDAMSVLLIQEDEPYNYNGELETAAQRAQLIALVDQAYGAVLAEVVADSFNA